MCTLQDTKAAVGSLQKLTSQERKKARITTLKDLFEIFQDNLVKKWDGYYSDEEADNGADLAGFIVDDDNFE